MENIKLLDVVALMEDIPEHHLHRGQVGTIVEVFEGGKAFEVEFSDQRGRTYESIGIDSSKLMILQYEPVLVAA